MVTTHRTSFPESRPDSLATLPAIFANLSDAGLLARLWLYRSKGGRPGYPLRPLWRAYVASFVLNLGSTNDVIRLLRRDRNFRQLCGFGEKLPHRTTFNRFISRLSHHPELVEESFTNITDKLKTLLPDLGQEVAVDSTAVRTHANPNRKTLSDPDATWMPKNSAKAKTGKEWYFGYKLHMIADANHGIPLAMKITTGSVNDSPELPIVFDKAREIFGWFGPKYAMADKGYDAKTNYQYLHDSATTPVILIRRPSNTRLRDGIYTDAGTPTCLGQVPMEYIRSDPEQGHLYRCRAGGCHLMDSKTGLVTRCDDEVWEDPRKNLRLFGTIELRRDSPEWRDRYAKRQAIERTFKSLKQSRRLERHCTRGQRQITLHCLVSVLSYQATAFVTAQSGRLGWMRWMVAPVA